MGYVVRREGDDERAITNFFFLGLPQTGFLPEAFCLVRAVLFFSASALQGICVQFVKENLTFTGDASPMANLLLSVMGAVAEFERELHRERQREGIALARQNRKSRGRKYALSAERAEELRQRAGLGESKTALAREFGISRVTLYQYLQSGLK